MAAELMIKHRTRAVDGFGKPVHLKVQEFRITFADGSALLAGGDHAEVVARVSEECQQYAIGQGAVVYNGPAMVHLTADQASIDKVRKFVT